MKEIKLTQGKVALVDDDDFERLNKFKWHYRKDGNNEYAVRSERIKGVSKSFMMHREIMMLEDNFIDHRDQNGLNNQKNNLRKATRSENCRNRRTHGRSRFLGVTFHKSSGRWQSKIQVQSKKKRLHLGTFDNEKEAAIAYNVAAKKYQENSQN